MYVGIMSGYMMEFHEKALNFIEDLNFVNS